VAPDGRRPGGEFLRLPADIQRAEEAAMRRAEEAEREVARKRALLEKQDDR
jgi:hypothetical protein